MRTRYYTSVPWISLSPANREKYFQAFTEQEYWRAKNSGEVLWSRVIKFQCLGGKFHQIRLDFPGRVTLLDHESKQAEKTMIDLGSPVPPCLTFLNDLATCKRHTWEHRPIVAAFLLMRQNAHTIHETLRSSYKDELDPGENVVDRKHLFRKRLNTRLCITLQSLRYKINKALGGEIRYDCPPPEELKPWQKELSIILPNKRKE